MESLNDDQMRDLNRLKAWLYHKRTTVRLDRERAERRQKKEEEAAKREAEQPRHYLTSSILLRGRDLWSRPLFLSLSEQNKQMCNNGITCLSLQ